MVFQKGTVAFVTGAGGGIGRATCQLLAQQGVTVVAVDINKEEADLTVRGLGGEGHLSYQLDVKKQEDVRACVRAVTARLGTTPTVAVNCAGLVARCSLLDVTEEIYNSIFDVNIKGTMWVSQAIIAGLMEAKKPGSVVNVSSLAKDGLRNGSVYCATKGAVESFSLSAAKEFGPYGIRVCCVAPGFVEDTSMGQGVPEVAKQKYINLTPLGRSATSREIAEVIVFLASDKSSFVTGTSVDVHGGFPQKN